MAATAAHYSPMTRIYLSGSLARKFFRFKDYQLDSGCAREGFKALKNTVDGFAEEIARLSSLGLRFAIFRNRKNSGEDDLGIGGTREIRIVPVISGAKRAGILQTVLGVVLIAMSSITNGATLAPGIALTAGGVIQMLSPQASGLKQSASPENSPSYAFGSAKNTTASGNPVPICIGERDWGGIIISASIYAQDKA
ncbi:tail assembly protein [Pseudomonas paralactis]|uniref:Tail assembly protein n=1 Tax=Pseudomonas paralactis TaxID=1615673 RepID=A0ABS0V4G7_9PSED|nr:tail assembly protein [Pseudomonas paralactis]MBI6635148.1 tail assembly protein [Pseudomonas paralactis]